MRKEEGATVAASHLPSLSGPDVSSGRTGSDSPRRQTLQESPIKYHKCPKHDTKRRRFQTQTDWLSNSDEQIHVKNAVVKA
jgi:hypothetical protein